jgi:hypothetical protein
MANDQAVPAPRVPGPAAALVAAICDDLAARPPFGDSRAELSDISAQCREPLRVAVTGDVSMGKSTLVNALVGQKVAKVAWQETTAWVTWYRHPALPPPRGQAPENYYESVSFPLADRLVLIDTPGVNTSSGHQEPTEAMLGGATRAAGSASVLLYMCGAEISGDTDGEGFDNAKKAEAGALQRIHEFATLTAGELARGLNVVLIGAKADTIAAAPAEIEDNLLRKAQLPCAQAVALSQQLAAMARIGALLPEHLGTLRTLALDPDLADATANGWRSLTRVWREQGHDESAINKLKAVTPTTFALVKSLPPVRDGTVGNVSDLATFWLEISRLAVLEATLIRLAEEADMFTVFAAVGRLRRLGGTLGAERATIIRAELDKAWRNSPIELLRYREAALVLDSPVFAGVSAHHRAEAIALLRATASADALTRFWHAQSLRAQSTLARTVANIVVQAALRCGE